MEALLREQWAVLRAWLDEVDIRRCREHPSGLPAWNVRELVAHLGYGLVMLDEVAAAPDGSQPMPVGDYVARYRSAAPVIARATHDVAADMPDELDGIDALASRAWAALDAGLAPVVMGRRGPLRAEDFLVTRLLELVVHGDDLHRAVPADTRSPVLPDAASGVAAMLARAYETRAGHGPAVDVPMRWIRLATGRVLAADPHLPLL